MGYVKPKAEAYPRTGSGQKQSGQQRTNRIKAALKAENKGDVRRSLKKRMSQK